MPTTVQSRRRHNSLSVPATLTISAVAASGAMASVFVSPLAAVATVGVALFLIDAERRVDRPVFEAVDCSTLPPNARAAAERTLDELESPDAHRLLAAVVDQARPIFATPHGDNTVREDAAVLVQVCCDAAREVSGLDATLGSSTSTAALEMSRRVAVVRVQLKDRLTRAANTLGMLYVSDLDASSPAAEQVSALIEEIVSDAKNRGAEISVSHQSAA